MITFPCQSFMPSYFPLDLALHYMKFEFVKVNAKQNMKLIIRFYGVIFPFSNRSQMMSTVAHEAQSSLSHCDVFYDPLQTVQSHGKMESICFMTDKEAKCCYW